MEDFPEIVRVAPDPDETRNDTDVTMFKREEGVEYLGGVVSLPGKRGSVTIDECERVSENGAIYTDENGCPECGADLEIHVIRDEDYARPRVNAEWGPGAEMCIDYNDGCSYNG